MSLSELGPQEVGLYVRVASIERRQTKSGTMIAMKLADASGTLPATLFDDHVDFNLVGELVAGDVVAVRGSRGSFKGNPRLDVSRIRKLDERDEGRWNEDDVFGRGLAGVRDLVADRIVFDIETAPLCDVRRLPPTLVEEVTRAAKDKDWPIDKVLALNPLFSRVVSIAIGNADSDGGTVLLAPEPDDIASLKDGAPAWLRPMSEAKMLASFWGLASVAQLVVSFNGRTFDLPFLRTRSSILGVPAVCDLLSQPPYLHAPHLDLYVILTGGGWGARPMNLDAACFAFGIESPKNAMDGSMVAQAFHEKRYAEIAQYNLADIAATRTLYHRIRDTVLEHLT